MKTLERIPAWKRIQQTPERVERLEQRIAQIEAQLKPGGSQCPMCAAMAFTLVSSEPDPAGGDLGIQNDQMSCSACGYSEHRQRDTWQ